MSASPFVHEKTATSMSTQPLTKSTGGSNLAKPPKTPGDEGEAARMGFMDHLMELRSRLWKAAVAIFICMIVALVFYKELWAFMRAPMDKLNATYEMPRDRGEQLGKLLGLQQFAPTPEMMDALSKIPDGPESTETQKKIRDIFELPPDAPKEATLLKIRATLDERDAYLSLLKKLNKPLTSRPVSVINPKPLSTIMMVMWLGVGAGLLFSSPIVLYELWAFISPGLKPSEKNAIKPILFGGVLFFLAGCFIAYEYLFPFSFQFFVWLDLWMEIEPLYSVEEYTTLLFNMLWITGLVCEIPLVIAGLAKLGLVSHRLLTGYWRVCILVSFILGSVFSPGSDIMSMLVFSALLLGLYVLSIVMAWCFYPKDLLARERKMEEERRQEEEAERRRGK